MELDASDAKFELWIPPVTGLRAHGSNKLAAKSGPVVLETRVLVEVSCNVLVRVGHIVGPPIERTLPFPAGHAVTTKLIRRRMTFGNLLGTEELRDYERWHLLGRRAAAEQGRHRGRRVRSSISARPRVRVLQTIELFLHSCVRASRVAAG